MAKNEQRYNMGIFASIRSWFMNLFRQQAVDKFNVDIIKSDLMEMAQDEWKSIIAGRPYWQDDNIRSINFAKFLCQYVAKDVSGYQNHCCRITQGRLYQQCNCTDGGRQYA